MQQRGERAHAIVSVNRPIVTSTSRCVSSSSSADHQFEKLYDFSLIGERIAEATESLAKQKKDGERG